MIPRCRSPGHIPGAAARPRPAPRRAAGTHRRLQAHRCARHPDGSRPPADRLRRGGELRHRDRRAARDGGRSDSRSGGGRLAPHRAGAARGRGGRPQERAPRRPTSWRPGFRPEPPRPTPATFRIQDFSAERPPAAAPGRGLGAGAGQGARAFHLWGPAGRLIVDLRARMDLHHRAVIARIGAGSAAPRPCRFGARRAGRQAGGKKRDHPTRLHRADPDATCWNSIELEARSTTTRSRNPPTRTMTAGLRSAPAPAGLKCRRRGHRIPAPTTPTTSRKPQTLSHAFATEPNDTRNTIKSSSSTTSAWVSNDDNQRRELCAAPRRGANSASAAAPVDAPDARNSAPSHGLSAQIGRFVTESKTPVYPATKNPRRPPTAATSLANTVPPMSRYHETNAHAPNNRIAHAPNEIGDQLLNIRLGKCSDWKIMCQKRSERPKSSVKRSPDSTAPQNAREYHVRITGRS